MSKAVAKADTPSPPFQASLQILPLSLWIFFGFSLLILGTLAPITTFLGKVFSPDGIMERPQDFLLSVTAILLWAATFGSFLLGKNSIAKPKETFWSHFSTAASFLIASIWIALGGDTKTLFLKEDGVLETATFLFSLTAVFLFLIAARNAKGIDRKILFLLALGSFFFSMEEISWGQRWFGWSTPASWAQLNKQGETNFHNLFDLRLQGEFLSILFSLFLLNRKHLKAFLPRAHTDASPALLPSENLVPLCLFIACAGAFRLPELSEELLSILLLAHAGLLFQASKHRPPLQAGL